MGEPTACPSLSANFLMFLPGEIREIVLSAYESPKSFPTWPTRCAYVVVPPPPKPFGEVDRPQHKSTPHKSHENKLYDLYYAPFWLPASHTLFCEEFLS